MLFACGSSSVSSSSRLPVRILLIFFVFATWQGIQFGIPYGGNQSALPYLLPGGGKDICLNGRTFKNKTECLQALLENYYGEYFNIYCPSLPLTLVQCGCKGCTWDRVDASKVDPTVTIKRNRSELFHEASKSCSIANHVKGYIDDYSYIRKIVFGFGTLGTLLLFFVTTYYSVPSSPEVVSGNVATKFGVTMPEPVFLLTLWILYHLGSFFPDCVRGLRGILWERGRQVVSGNCPPYLLCYTVNHFSEKM